MRVAVIGTGYVGLVTGACFAELGHEVVCHDINKEKIAALKDGTVPFYEPGLEELVKRNIKEGRLSFTVDIAEAIQFGEVVMSAVGTPPDKDHKADLQYVREVARNFAENLLEGQFKVFVNKSTVPVGTADICCELISQTLQSRGVKADFEVVSNPEFLREGRAIDDTFNPERIIVGLSNERAQELMAKLYQPLVRTGRPLVFTDIKSAEVIKYAANAFLATKISFINEMANFCEKVGADVREVSKGIGLDSRIGSKFLHAGIGYGGSCFPKDVKALIQSGNEVGQDFKILKAVDDVNERQKVVLVEKFVSHFQGQVHGLSVAIWGLAFKPKTDDLRCAPAVEIIRRLLGMGVKVRAFDPVAMENFKVQYPDIVADENFVLAEDAFAALEGVDALMVVTEWNEFRGIAMSQIKAKMKGDLLLDGRNIYQSAEAAEAGLIYKGMGLP